MSPARPLGHAQPGSACALRNRCQNSLWSTQRPALRPTGWHRDRSTPESTATWRAVRVAGAVDGGLCTTAHQGRSPAHPPQVRLVHPPDYRYITDPLRRHNRLLVAPSYVPSGGGGRRGAIMSSVVSTDTSQPFSSSQSPTRCGFLEIPQVLESGSRCSSPPNWLLGHGIAASSSLPLTGLRVIEVGDRAPRGDLLPPASSALDRSTADPGRSDGKTAASLGGEGARCSRRQNPLRNALAMSWRKSIRTLTEVECCAPRCRNTSSLNSDTLGWSSS